MYNTNRQMGLTRPAVPQSRPTPPPPNNAPRPAPPTPPRPAPAPPRPAAAPVLPPQRPAPPSSNNSRPAAGSAGPFLPPAQHVVAQPARAPKPPLGTGGFLPSAQPSAQRPNNNPGRANASTAQYANAPAQYANAPAQHANAPAQYANAPAQYANIPTMPNSNAPANPYGSMNAVAASTNARPVNNPYAQLRPVQNWPANGALPPAQPAAPQNAQRAEPRANQVMTEKRDERNPAGDKMREVSAVAERAVFRGQIVAPTGNGGLILKPAGPNASETLIHLSKEAADQLRERSGSLLKRSMQSGSQGPEVQVAHLKGQWSATETIAPTKKIG